MTKLTDWFNTIPGSLFGVVLNSLNTGAFIRGNFNFWMKCVFVPISVLFAFVGIVFVVDEYRKLKVALNEQTAISNLLMKKLEETTNADS